jgi:hypothetical protein
MASSPVQQSPTSRGSSARDPSPDPNGIQFHPSSTSIPTDTTSNRPHNVHNEDVAEDVEEDYNMDQEDSDNMTIQGLMASPGYPRDGGSAHILQVAPTLLFGAGPNLLE